MLRIPINIPVPILAVIPSLFLLVTTCFFFSFFLFMFDFTFLFIYYAIHFFCINSVTFCVFPVSFALKHNLQNVTKAIVIAHHTAGLFIEVF